MLLYSQSHVPCYVKNGFCDVMMQTGNWDALWKIYEFGDFIGEDWALASLQVRYIKLNIQANHDLHVFDAVQYNL